MTDPSDREYLDSVIAQSKRRLARIIVLEDALTTTRAALHEACLKIGSTEGFRGAFKDASDALAESERE